jgi:hypothetical protein
MVKWGGLHLTYDGQVENTKRVANGNAVFDGYSRINR